MTRGLHASVNSEQTVAAVSRVIEYVFCDANLWLAGDGVLSSEDSSRVWRSKREANTAPKVMAWSGQSMVNRGPHHPPGL